MPRPRAAALAVLAAAVAALAPAARAADDPVELRMAAIAPPNSEWSSQALAFARDVEASSEGRVRVRWYFGAAAGDEATVLDRIMRGQLDGAAGAFQCERVAPSLRAVELIGLVEREADARKVLAALRPRVEEDLRHTPFVFLFLSTGFGHRVLFSRTPVRDLDDLRRGRFWIWNGDDVLHQQLVAMGVHVVPLPLEEGARAADEGRIDGYIVIPTAALLFRFSSKTRYYTDLSSGFLPGCLVMSRTRHDALAPADRRALDDAAERLRLAFEEAGRRRDDTLLRRTFIRQGLVPAPMDAAFRADLLAAGRRAIEVLDGRLAPPDLLRETRRVLSCCSSIDTPP